MSERKSFNRGILVGMLILVGADAMHWFITPHPGASSARTVVVALQAILGFGVALGMYLYQRRASPTSSAV